MTWTYRLTFAIGLASTLGALSGCLERDPDFIKSDGGGDTSADAGSESGSETSNGSTNGDTTDGGGTDTTDGGTTDAGSTDTGTTDAGTTDTGDTDTGGTDTTGGDGCQDPTPTDCFGVCVDTQTDADHCGECGNKCNPAQEQCVEGMCVPN